MNTDTLSAALSATAATPSPAPDTAPGPNAPPDWPDWYRLTFDFRIRLQDKLALLKHFGSAAEIFSASPESRARVIGQAAANAIGSPEDELGERLAATGAWLAASPRHALVALGDPAYPPGLLNLSDPPLLLYVSGHLASLALPAIAIVGSRSATPQGLANARAFAKSLAQAGHCIVSGLALGIDAAAHDGALLAEAPGGAQTLALIGTGIDRVYPAVHRKLSARIEQQGAVVTELPLGTPPLPHHFPRRNRLIAAFAKGVLVVEAARQSGSLITAALAAEMGREVFAIPGSIHSPVSRGCHHLIRQGAKLVESAQDIIEELGPQQRALAFGADHPVAAGDRAASTLPDDPVLLALGFEPVLLSELLERIKLPSGLIQKRLLELELAGRIARMDDGRLLQIAEAS